MIWQSEEDKKKYHLVNWKTCCLPKQQGGLGITNIEMFNIALLAKWLWKLENDEGFGTRLLKKNMLGTNVFLESNTKMGIPNSGLIS